MKRYSRTAEKKLAIAGEATRPVSHAAIPVEYVVLRRDPGDSGTVYVGGPDGYPLGPGDSIRLDGVVLSDVDIYVPDGVTANVYAVFKNKPMTALEIARLAPREHLFTEYLFEPMGTDSTRVIDTSGHGRHGANKGCKICTVNGKPGPCNPRPGLRGYIDTGVRGIEIGKKLVVEVVAVPLATKSPYWAKLLNAGYTQTKGVWGVAPDMSGCRLLVGFTWGEGAYVCDVYESYKPFDVVHIIGIVGDGTAELWHNGNLLKQCTFPPAANPDWRVNGTLKLLSNMWGTENAPAAMLLFRLYNNWAPQDTGKFVETLHDLTKVLTGCL